MVLPRSSVLAASAWSSAGPSSKAPPPLPRPRRRRQRRRDLTSDHMRYVEAVVASTFGLPLGDLFCDSRGDARRAFARQVAMYVGHVWCGLSLTEIGLHFDRDRTTVAHACRLVEDRRDDAGLDRVLSAIESATALWHRVGRDEADPAVQKPGSPL